MSGYELTKDVIEKIELRKEGISGLIQVALQDLYYQGFKDGYRAGVKLIDNKEV